MYGLKELKRVADAMWANVAYQHVLLLGIASKMQRAAVATIGVEVWELAATASGSFVAGIPAPHGIGTVELADGSRAQGFVCEAYAVAAATDLTALGGWRAHLATTKS